MTWQADAACRGSSLDFTDPAHEDAALLICASCTTREPCLEAALARGDLGVWGGTTDRQRDRLPRLRACLVCGKSFRGLPQPDLLRGVRPTPNCLTPRRGLPPEVGMTDLLTLVAKSLTDAVEAVEGNGAHVGMGPYTDSLPIDIDWYGVPVYSGSRLKASVYGLRTYVDVTL